MARLDTVKVGDLVVVSWRQSRRIATVERVTATQFVADGVRYTKNGTKVGEGRDAWASTYARLATPELIAEVQLEQSYADACNRLRRNTEKVVTARHGLGNRDDRFLCIADIEKAAALVDQAVRVLERQQDLEVSNG